MVTDGEAITKNKVKELLRSATPPKGKRWGRERFLLASIAIVALTAISYRPADIGGRMFPPRGPEEIARAPATFEYGQAQDNVVRYPLTTVVKVALGSGDELYLEYRTAAMLGAVRLAKADEFRPGSGYLRGDGASGSW